MILIILSQRTRVVKWNLKISQKVTKKNFKNILKLLKKVETFFESFEEKKLDYIN